MSAHGSYSDEKKGRENVNVHHVAAKDKDVDTAAQLAAQLDGELSPEEATRIRKKIDWHIMPMMCSESVHFLFFSMSLFFLWGKGKG